MDPRLEVFWIVAGAAGLILITSIPMMLGKVPPNRWYGVRTRRSTSGTEAEWYAINRTGGIVLFCVSVAALAILALYVLIARPSFL